MSAQGGNLQQPSKKVLFNSITADDLGFYFDTEFTTNMLQFKKHGFSIPVMPLSQIQVAHTVHFIPKVTLYALTGNMPCVECNYEYGIGITKRVKKPGVDNSDYYPHNKLYGGTILKPIEDVGNPGHLISAQIQEMGEAIIVGINTDKGLKPGQAYEHPGAIVKAGTAHIVSGYTAGDTIQINGAAIIGAGLTTVAQMVAAINAQGSAYAYVHPTTATSFVIIALETSGNGITFTVNVVGMTLSAEYIGLTAKYTDVDFSVRVEPFFGNEVLRVRNVRFSSLSSDEVFQKFSHLPNKGILAAETRSNGPADVDFAKIVIITPQMHYDLSGASHANVFIGEVEIYIPESVLNDATKKWSSANPMVAGANWSLDELTDNWFDIIFGHGYGWATLVGNIVI